MLLREGQDGFYERGGGEKVMQSGKEHDIIREGDENTVAPSRHHGHVPSF